MQEDSLQPFLSLEELLFHVATLKLPRHYTGKQKKAVVEEIITSFGLEGCRDQRTESLSGGQRRRLYVAMELVDNPPVIFLDEPTTGLDNVSAGSILRLLQHVAHQGRTVICTIHQPSAKHFRYFDRVYVVGKGKCIYHGSTDHLVPFLSSAGLPCPINHNPADFSKLSISKNHLL
ncbi:hypothetical protein AAG570_013670 [Ranatra chinensis]|uniref:ABC transporter domain-containing protein n=1 Tax=Ranatra chinensis TaxID=642074 RepID=A0ABD0YER2_9HEMI